MPSGEPFVALAVSTVWQVVAAYLFVGAVVCLVHPLLLRKALSELTTAKFHSHNIFVKPMVGFVTCALFITLWPVAWFNAGKSERKASAALDAQYEGLRPFLGLYAAINARVTYAGGDGSSFAQAIVVRDANLLSGPRAEYEFIEQHYPGSKVSRQSLKEQNLRKYDVFEFVTVDGQNKSLYFDISDSLRRRFGLDDNL